MPEKIQKPLSVIERLRTQYPNRNICDVAVGKLDNPREMSEFMFQYAHELAQAPVIPETRVHPFDTAIELVNRMAGFYGGEIARRWYEFIDTGTVQDSLAQLPPFLARRRRSDRE